MQDKNRIGLIKYLSLMIILSSLPVLFIWLFFILINLARAEASNFIISILFFIFIITPFVYFISSITITTKAIRNHWSEYLDKFFYQLKIPTIFFFISTAYLFLCWKFLTTILIFFQHYYLGDYYAYPILYYYFCVGLVPTYVIVYLTMVGNFIYRQIKKT